MTRLDYIVINGEDIYKPVEFSPQREDIYRGEYTTCTGDTIADRIGWKYSDMTLKWDALPQDMVDILIGMTGECTLTFDDLDGTFHTETIVRKSAVALRHRFTQRGQTIWKDVEVSITFIKAHTDDEVTP